jgi:hypothetical protein
MGDVTITDSHVETLQRLLEQLSPYKGKMNFTAIHQMDNDHCSAEEKFIMLLGTTIDYYRYGN